MSTAEAKRRMDRNRTDPRMDDFYDALRDSRPFAAVRVSEPSPFDVDVAAIHAAAFDKLVGRAGESLTHRRGVGVVLMGAAGVGKSHLLSRLSRWAAEPVGNDRSRACYVFLHNILADPERLPRYLLKYVVNVLARGRRGPLHQTPLFRLVDHAVRHALKEAGAKPSEMTLKGGGRAFRTLMEQEGVDAEIQEVLFGFYRHAHPAQKPNARRDYVAAAAVGWLSGEEIDAEAARDLGLNAQGQESVDLKDDQQVEQVVMALCRLALIRNQPFVLCVDQVDNLDAEKLMALTRFLHVLIDHVPNLLVITSGVRSTLDEFAESGVIPEAAWDRMAEHKVLVSRIKSADARRILEARLERFLEPFMQLEPVRRHVQEDSLFPIGRGWLDDRLADGIEFRPRDVLMWARDAWEDQQAALDRLGESTWIERWPNVDGPGGGTTIPLTEEEIAVAIDAKVGRKIEEQIEGHRLQPGSLPPDAGNLSGLVLTLLEQCRGEDLPYTIRNVKRLRKTAGRLPPYDLLVHERRESDGLEVTTGILFVTTSGTSASKALGRLLGCDPSPDHRLLVTAQEQQPLTVGPQGLAYYKDLKKLGPEAFHHVKLTFEQYARLDALVGVVSQAKVGDLEVEVPRGTIRPVSEAEAIASHHRQDRYRAHPLLSHLLTESPSEGSGEVLVQPQKTVDEADARQFIMAQLAWQMGTTNHALAKGYVKAMPALKLDPERTRSEFRAIVTRLHDEGKVHATPQEDDLFVQLLGA